MTPHRRRSPGSARAAAEAAQGPSRPPDRSRRADSGQRAHVAQEGLHLDAPAGDKLDQRLGVESAPVTVNTLGQPGLDRPDLAAAQILLARSELGLDRLPQLRGDQTAERVARKVSEAAGGPVDVLQAAERIGGHLEPEPAAPSSAASTSAKAGLRATWFSQSLLWDSWIDIEVPHPTLVRSSAGSTWRSYRAWPYSCSELSSDSTSPSL